jgi:RNA polymerase sigma-70 factor (ECF subfamily)
MSSLRAVERLYAEHFRFVWRTLRRLGIPEDEVADAVQDVFLVVHRKLPDWEGRSKVTTWLFGICLRVASERRRSVRARREVVSDEAGSGADERETVVEALDRKRNLQELEAILEELPLEQRAVFACFELDGMQGEEIAELMSIPLGTVYSRLRLARKAFRAGVRRREARRRFGTAAARVRP